MTTLKGKLDRLRMPAPKGRSKAAHPVPPVESLEGHAKEADATLAFESLDRAERLTRLRAQMVHMERREPQARRPVGPIDAEGLPGERLQTGAGVLRCVRHLLEEDHLHGVPVANALGACAREMSVLALDPALAEVDLSRALFIDTETTGLSGGSGTVPFLIGVAGFEGRRLWVEQYLLEQLGQEGPMLARLAEHLAQASCVVSYNGKSFDWPLLRTRFVMHRIAVTPPVVHLDLLHCARRIFKRRLGAVRLVHVEEQVLGFSRVDDIPGSLIPATYLGYLRGRVAAEALSPIVEHNRLDLIALAALLGELSVRFGQQGAETDARDQLGMAEVAARAHQTDRAIALAEAAADADVRGELSSQACWLAGRWAKQRGDLEGARRAFRDAAGHARDEEEAARAHLELAKLCEHQLREWDQALVHAAHTAAAEGEEAHR